MNSRETKASVLVLVVTAALLASSRLKVLLAVVLSVGALAFLALLVLYPLVGVCIVSFLACGHISVGLSSLVFSGVLVFAVVAWLIRFFLNSDTSISFTRVELGVALYVSALLLSIVFSANVESGLPFLLPIAKRLALFVLLISIVRDERSALLVSIAGVAGVVLSGLVGLWSFLQERTIVMPGAIFRAAGFAGDPNTLALAIITVAPILAYLGLIAERKATRTAVALAGIVLFGANLVTLSRTGIIGMTIVLVAFAVRERHRTWVKVSVVSLLAVLPFSIPPEFWRRIGTVGMAAVDFSAQLRVGTLRAGLQMFVDSPVTGIGLGNYLEQSTQYGDLITPLFAHNMFLHTLAEGGIIGLSAMLFLIVSSLRAMVLAERLAERDSVIHYLARGYIIAYGAFLFAGLFLSIQFDLMFWFMPAASVFLLQVARDRRRSLRRSLQGV